MEIEEKILKEIQSYYVEETSLDSCLLQEINKMIICEAVKVKDREKTEKEALSFIENKLYDLFPNIK